MADSTVRKHGSTVIILGITAIVTGFLFMNLKDVIDAGNNAVMFRFSPFYFIVGLLIYSWGVISICYLLWKTESYQISDKNHIGIRHRIMRRDSSSSESKHFANVTIEIGFLLTVIGIIGSPFFMTFISSSIFYTLGRPQVSYVPTLAMTLIGIIVLIYGFWVKYISLMDEERTLVKNQSHSSIRSWRLSTGNLSGLDSLSNKVNLAEIRNSKRFIRPLILIIILITAIIFNPLLSPVDGIHDSDLDGYADSIDVVPFDPRFWSGEDTGISFILEQSENTTDWLIVISEIQSSRQVFVNEVFVWARSFINDVFLPPTPLSEMSSSHYMGVHFNDSPPIDYLNIGDQISLDKSVYGKSSMVQLKDSTGVLSFGFITIQ